MFKELSVDYINKAFVVISGGLLAFSRLFLCCDCASLGAARIMENNAFLHDLHLNYIHKVSQETTAFEYLVTEHLRMSGVYWGLTAVATLGATAAELRNDEKLRVGEQIGRAHV